MKVIGVRVNEPAKVEQIDGSLESMQKFVGGYIEMLPLEDELVLICNEEGKLNHLPFNRLILNEKGQPYDVIAGDFFICNAPFESENFESVPDDKVDYLLKKYA